MGDIFCRRYSVLGFERDCGEFGLAVRTMVMNWNMYIHCAHKDERGVCGLWFVWTLESEDVCIIGIGYEGRRRGIESTS